MNRIGSLQLNYQFLRNWSLINIIFISPNWINTQLRSSDYTFPIGLSLSASVNLRIELMRSDSINQFSDWIVAPLIWPIVTPIVMIAPRIEPIAIPSRFVATPIVYWPRLKFASPIELVASPIRLVASPIRPVAPPIGLVTPAIGLMASPIRLVASPIRLMSSPNERVANPIRLASTPTWLV